MIQKATFDNSPAGEGWVNKTSKSVGLIENKVNFCETGAITTQIKYLF